MVPQNNFLLFSEALGYTSLRPAHLNIGNYEGMHFHMPYINGLLEQLRVANNLLNLQSLGLL